MASPDEPKGVDTPSGETAHERAAADNGKEPAADNDKEKASFSEAWSTPGASAVDRVASVVETAAARLANVGGGGKPPKPPDSPDEEDDGEDEGMARMSFLEHLEELRKRLLLGIGGIGVAFFLCLFFSDQLWSIVFAPAGTALRHLKVNPPTLKLINPMDSFQIMWMKLPILAAVFISSPWILYQVWAFIAPGLYKRERRWAAPFVISSAGLFILGGFFAYFVAFRYGLEFLLGLGIGKGVDPGVNITEYYDLFVDVMLGVGIIFEIPVLLFLLTLIKIASPSFLVRHSRYAILVIVILAAVITPTGDVFNLALFATPMIILFYVGILASYILVLSRENRRFPWGTFLKWLGIVVVILLAIGWMVLKYYGYHFLTRWPFFIR
ncbi:MAG TPA: twin-arginine translocase subunit TatC [Bryobacteraceae bacterium]|jgi:sec-independent protein translocase protein TatC|nr:twin-arginine translocase subunit TatC [Bryobacteraceae bacterium]